MEKGLTWEKRLNDGDIIRKMNPSRSRIKKFETVAIVELASPDIEARHAPGMGAKSIEKNQLSQKKTT